MVVNQPGTETAARPALYSPIVELRRYTMRPGAREVLVRLFEGAFIEPQEEAGMHVIGHFREPDDPDVFTWLRGFRGMHDRARSLAEFYFGDIWRAHRDAANATMLTSDDVLLLRPARPSSAFALTGPRAPRGSDAPAPGIVEATILELGSTADENEVLSFFELAVAQCVEAEGGTILGYFLTEPSRNDFPELPVREDVNVFVFFSGFADSASHAAGREDSEASRAVCEAPGLSSPPRVLHLEPAARSLLTGTTHACPARAVAGA